jgi:hypothetical protein
MAALETLTTKPSEKFVGVIAADRLEMVANSIPTIPIGRD